MMIQTIKDMENSIMFKKKKIPYVKIADQQK